MFTRAITRKPSRSMVNGLTTSNLGKPDYDLALNQHAAYVTALKSCGLEVRVLEADERYPDSTFVEDTALLTKSCAIITNPGAPTRTGETESIRQVLEEYYNNIEVLKEPGTVEGGDIMMVGSHFFIGLSARTNKNGAQQVIAYLEKYGMSGSVVVVEDMLHLKTGISYLENNTIAATKEYLNAHEFKQFEVLQIEENERYAANCIWVNGTIIVATGYPNTAQKISDAGYPVIEVDVSEFRKLDGGLSCLSLRF